MTTQEEKKEFHTLREGATYTLPLWTLTQEGLQRAHGYQRIEFVKGNKDNLDVFRQDGIVTEGLLSMLISHLKELNKNVPSEYTDEAIGHLEKALECFDRRIADRIKRDVLGTYKE